MNVDDAFRLLVHPTAGKGAGEAWVAIRAYMLKFRNQGLDDDEHEDVVAEQITSWAESRRDDHLAGRPFEVFARVEHPRAFLAKTTRFRLITAFGKKVRAGDAGDVDLDQIADERSGAAEPPDNRAEDGPSRSQSLLSGLMDAWVTLVDRCILRAKPDLRVHRRACSELLLQRWLDERTLWQVVDAESPGLDVKPRKIAYDKLSKRMSLNRNYLQQTLDHWSARPDGFTPEQTEQLQSLLDILSPRKPR